MKVLVTGANGFVGTAVCHRLMAAGHHVVGAVRRPVSLPTGVEPRLIGPLDGNHDWTEALAGMEAVVHLAARVHVMRDSAADPLAEFRRANTAATVHLARDAARLGLRRMVFMSTIKVNGEGGAPPYTAADPPAPRDPYGLSKAEAEAGLREIAAQTDLAITILRPPLVYGPGVGGNFRTLLNVVARALPLPLAAIDNRRSLIHVGNLADAVRIALDTDVTGAETFLVSDGEDISTPDLIRRLAALMNRPARLIPIPPRLLRVAGGLSGRGAAIDRLTGSLQVDGSAFRTRFAWTPPVGLDQGLAETVTWFMGRRG
jgi:UDP-glucose 4-epimerase